MLGRITRVGLILVALAALSWLAYLFFMYGDTATRKTLISESGKMVLQLFLIVLGGVGAKYLIDRQSAAREKASSLRSSQLQALNDVTASYFRIKKALHIIEAHRTAKSYGEQVRLIIDDRTTLQQLRNQIEAGDFGFKKSGEIAEHLGQIDGLLGSVIDEWKREYPKLSKQQRQDEVRWKALDERWKENFLAESKGESLPVIHEPFTDGTAAASIGALKELQALRDEGTFTKLHQLFTEIVDPMRAQMKTEMAVDHLRSVPESDSVRSDQPLPDNLPASDVRIDA